MALADTLYAAIKRQENVPTQYNNPGGLSPGGVLATYPSPSAGDAAGTALVQHYIDQGLTLGEMLAKWAPASVPGNDPIVYAANVSRWTGVPADTPLNQVESGGGGGVYYASGGGIVDAGGGNTYPSIADALGLASAMGDGGLGAAVAIGLGILALALVFGD